MYFLHKKIIGKFRIWVVFFLLSIILVAPLAKDLPGLLYFPLAPAEYTEPCITTQLVHDKVIEPDITDQSVLPEFIHSYTFTQSALNQVIGSNITSQSALAEVTGPSITAQTAVLIEGSSGQVLYKKNAHQRRPPASTTKMMTALIALEKGKLQEPVTISRNAVRAGGSTLGLQTGEVYPLEELIEGALIRSGNDACVAIGEHIGGTEAFFLQLMNQKAIALGARDTNFRNTNGMPAPNHYSSAYDLALIARYALCNSDFARIVSCKFATISSVPLKNNPGKKSRELPIKNTNALLWSYSGADGVKTGTTVAAGACLVASATREGRQLIAVVLKSQDRFGDAARLLDFGFNQFVEIKAFKRGEVVAVVPVEKGIPRSVELIAKDDLMITVPAQQVAQVKKHISVDSPLRAPLKSGDTVGVASLILQDHQLQNTLLVTDQTVEEISSWWKFW